MKVNAKRRRRGSHPPNLDGSCWWRTDQGQGTRVNRSAVRPRVDEGTNRLEWCNCLTLSNPCVRCGAANPITEVNDRSIDSDRDPNQRHQRSAPGMWWTGSEGDTCLTNSGPTPNRA
jgi:hypothetical protein